MFFTLHSVRVRYLLKSVWSVEHSQDGFEINHFLDGYYKTQVLDLVSEKHIKIVCDWKDF